MHRKTRNEGKPQKLLLGVVGSELVHSWPNDDDGDCQGRKDVTLFKWKERLKKTVVRIAMAGAESCCREI
jgi:hypothetical protein